MNGSRIDAGALHSHNISQVKIYYQFIICSAVNYFEKEYYSRLFKAKQK